jgi:hypothetical protein
MIFHRMHNMIFLSLIGEETGLKNNNDKENVYMQTLTLFFGLEE